MKFIYTCLLCCIASSWAQAQDTTNAWQPSISLDAEPVPTLAVSNKNDTSYHNSLSLTSVFTIRHRSGWGISYAPAFVLSSSRLQLYVQRLTIGLEQYDRPKYTWVMDYAHDFFSSHSPLPYIPLNNEGYALFKYKKISLHPVVEADIGWGRDSSTMGKMSYDLNFAAGIEYAFQWDFNQVELSVTPSLLGNIGTDSYFFLSRIAPYISHSKGFIKYLKNPHYAGSRGAVQAGRHVVNMNINSNPVVNMNNSNPHTTSVTQVSSGLNRMQFNNIATGAEISLSWLSWTLRSDIQAFLPVGSSATHTISAYFSMTCEYDF
ncbi:hypothetical protein [Thermoflavifilum aggregans]|nr:hypothetical protein [Thermoflavifilum aggregans]